MAYGKAQIESAIKVALEDFGNLEPEKIGDVAFHLTDWLTDLERLHKFYSSPDLLSREQVQRLLIDFLVHVPAHLAAASKIITSFPVADVFEVGATTE
ncbi:MAG: hypothetical protein M1438_20620 [Deltaproteobacteria bacterium]|nr:hypothetical protein [Deltaproteobacteria bacterium]